MDKESCPCSSFVMTSRPMPVSPDPVLVSVTRLMPVSSDPVLVSAVILV